MTTFFPAADSAVFYPSSDGEPLAETYDHLNAIIAILEVLRAYLSGQQATVLADQFLYYAQGYPRLRIAPDVMVIFNVEPGGRDNYKIWEEGEVPQVVFEVTSPSTRIQDESHKKTLYEQIGVNGSLTICGVTASIPAKILLISQLPMAVVCHSICA
jgi:Uma2 family endonuclease